MSGIRNENVLRQQLEFLESENEIERYWAAIGLRSQNLSMLLPFVEDLEKAINDNYTPVSITLAAILYELNQSEQAIERLNQFILSENAHFSLMAINYLLYTEQKEPFIESVKKVYESESSEYNISAASKDFLGSLGLIPNNFEYR